MKSKKMTARDFLKLFHGWYVLNRMQPTPLMLTSEQFDRLTELCAPKAKKVAP